MHKRTHINSLVVACCVCVALCVGALMVFVPAGAAETAHAAVEYRVTAVEGGVMVVSYSGDPARLSMPSVWDGRPVVRLAASVFEGKKALKEVSLPDSLTSFETGTFEALPQGAHVYNYGSLAIDSALSARPDLTLYDFFEETAPTSSPLPQNAELTALLSHDSTTPAPHTHTWQYVRVVPARAEQSGYLVRVCGLDDIEETVTLAPLARPTSATVHFSTTSVRVGESVRVTTSPSPKNALAEVTLTSSAPAVASVSGTAVRALRPGTTEVSVTVRLAEGKSMVTKRTITVNPGAVGVVAGYGANKQVRLDWGSVSGATRYRVERASSFAGTYKTVASTNRTAAVISTSGTRMNKTYYYRVVAYSGARHSTSAPVGIRTRTGSTRPSTLRFSVISGGSYRVALKGVPRGARVHYASSDRRIATVDSRGIVKGHATGTARIVMTYKGVRSTLCVVVRTAPQPTQTTVLVRPGQGASVRLRDVGGVWRSGNSRIAKVSRSGHIRGVHTGATTAYCTYRGRTYRVRITVRRPSISLRSATVQARHALKMSVSMSGAVGTPQWSSSNPSVARVYRAGEVQGLKPGTATITVRANGAVARATVTVTPYDVTQELDKLDLSGVEKLMIVAHPDDDLIWGGAALIKDEYLVVNVTAGVNPARALEFKRAMRATGDHALLLSYPDFKNNDYTLRQIDAWDTTVQSSLTSDLRTILTYKPWSQVVTHSPDGESGHQHHRKTSGYVTQEYLAAGYEPDSLYYFGHIYDVRRSGYNQVLPYLTQPIDSNTAARRSSLMRTYYPSQKSVITFWDYLGPYEQIIPAPQWRSMR